jgi:hypothetical protein
MEAFDTSLAKQVLDDIALKQGQAAVRLKEEARCSDICKLLQEGRKRLADIDGPNGVARFGFLLLCASDTFADVDCFAVG